MGHSLVTLKPFLFSSSITFGRLRHGRCKHEFHFSPLTKIHRSIQISLTNPRTASNCFLYICPDLRRTWTRLWFFILPGFSFASCL